MKREENKHTIKKIYGVIVFFTYSGSSSDNK